MFFDDASSIFPVSGRLKANIKLGKPERDRLDQQTLSTTDFVDVIDYVLKMRKGIGEADDIDHLGNRRVASGGELLEISFASGSCAWSARSREDVDSSGDADGYASRFDQREAGDRGGSGVLRFIAVVAVHGSDKSAFGDHPQTPPLGAWARRPVT